MRLFTAVDLSSDSRAAMAAEQSRIADTWNADGPRFVGPELLHVTLVFIGEVAADRVQVFVQRMSEPVALEPFLVTFGDVLVFPPRGAPRVLSIGARQGTRELTRLHETIQSRLETLGVPSEGRAFRPHVTIARWPKAQRSGNTGRAGHAAGAGGRAEAREIGEMTVSEVTLFESRLSSGASIYVPLARAPLGKTVNI